MDEHTGDDKQEAYAAFRARLEADFLAHPALYVTAMDIMRAGIIPNDAYDAENRHIMQTAQRVLRITFKQFQSGLDKWRKELDAQARQQQQDAAARQRETQSASTANQRFGGTPQDARQAVEMFCAAQQVHVMFNHDCTARDEHFWADGTPVSASSVLNRILLAAEAQGLTIGEGHPMSTTAIKLAWEEHVACKREERRRAVWERIATTDSLTAAKALRQLRELCEQLFEEPAFADAAIRKFIWQVKRRMKRMYIRHLHFLVLGGGQETGKTALCRAIMSPIAELSCEAAMDQVVDDRNFALRDMYCCFVDELARAERADVNKVKNVVTATSATSRKLFTHGAEKAAINLTLLGTADRRLRTIIYDIAGMRRFVEVMTKPRHLAPNLDWQAVVEQSSWLALWQAVDHTTVDPLMCPQFEEVLRNKQEDMRGRDIVEAWLEAFDIDPKRLNSFGPTQYVPNEFVEFGASDLFLRSFRAYEDQFRPGKKSDITYWGSTFAALIDAHRAPGWSYIKRGNKKFYHLELSNVVPMPHSPPSPKQVVVVVAGKTASKPR